MPASQPMIVFLARNRGIPSLRDLRKTLRDIGIKATIAKKGTRPAHRKSHPENLYINWGLTPALFAATYKTPTIDIAPMLLNPFDRVRQASDKIRTFKLLQEHNVRTVPYYTYENLDELEGRLDWNRVPLKKVWLLRKRYGSGGRDILVRVGVDFPYLRDYIMESPGVNFVSEYVYKNSEYRIHSTPSSIVSASRKVLITEDHPGWAPPMHAEFSKYIRNRANNYIFARLHGAAIEGSPSNNLIKDELGDLNTKAVNALGLNFGGVDIICGNDGRSYVLEVNTAPGMEGLTLSDYANFIINKWGQMRGN